MENRDHRLLSIQEILPNVNSVNYNEEIVVFDTHGALSKANYPLKIDALAFCICLKGGGRITVDLNEYKFGPNSLLAISPQNYLSDFEYDGDTLLRVVLCSKNMVENVLPKLSELLPLLINMSDTPMLTLTPEQSSSLLEYIDMLDRKVTGEWTPFQKSKVVCLLQSMMLEILELRSTARKKIEVNRTRKEEILAKFLLLVNKNFREHRLVSYYADVMCMTPKHLSSVVKETSGKTARDIIEGYVVMEAKVKLRNTDLSIQEISDALHFANQSYFGKYFKHITGQTPTDYRQSNAIGRE